MRRVSRELSAPQIVEGVVAPAAMMRARFVIDLEPGIRTVPSTAEEEYGAVHKTLTGTNLKRMCGRFVLFTTGDALLEAASEIAPFPVLDAPSGTPPERYNIAPTQQVAILHSLETPGKGVLEAARWGLIPHWKRHDGGPALFNARAETVTEKPSFRDAFTTMRCVIPMDGYYEWHTQGKQKTPYFVHRDSGELMWAAGLYSWGQRMLSTTILTTTSTSPLEWLHDRMPRFLAPAEVKPWLLGSAEDARSLLHPTPDEVRGGLTADEVGKEVGNIRNDYPGLIAPPARLL